MSEILKELTEIRATRPEAVAEALAAGRTLLYPPDGDVGAAVDAAIVSGEAKPVRGTEVR